jgi:hypothetical protein
MKRGWNVFVSCFVLTWSWSLFSHFSPNSSKETRKTYRILVKPCKGLLGGLGVRIILNESYGNKLWGCETKWTPGNECSDAPPDSITGATELSSFVCEYTNKESDKCTCDFL